MAEFSIPNQEWLRILIISGIFISIFVTSELISVLLKPSVEVTRKFVHFTGGMVTLSFSYLFTSHWSVLILSLGFVGILYTTKKLNLLKSVHGIERPSSGGIYFPFAVYLTWLASNLNHQPDYYLIGMLILSISDSMAALVGTTYGKFLFLIEKERKSVEGTVIFFLITFLITEQSMLHLTEVGAVKASLCGIYVAILVTGFELISLKGSDNFFIPVGTVYILLRYPRQTQDEMIFQLLLLIVLLFSFIFIGKLTRVFGFSALVGIGLMAYGSWGLVDYPWFIPVATAFCLATFGFGLKKTSQQDPKRFRIRTVFYLLGIMLIWILIANLFLDFQSIFIVPYIFSVVSVLDLFWRRHIILLKTNGIQVHRFLQPNQILRLLILFLVFYPVQQLFYPDLNLLAAAITVIPLGFIYTLITEKVYAKIHESYHRIDVMMYNLVMSIGFSVVVLGTYMGLTYGILK